MWNSWRTDPGPCPVDDAPHTTCTAPTVITSRVQPTQTVTMPFRRPGWMREPPAAPAAQIVSEPFTTASYKRKKTR